MKPAPLLQKKRKKRNANAFKILALFFIYNVVLSEIFVHIFETDWFILQQVINYI